MTPSELFLDLRLGARLLTKQKLLKVAVIATLALGIGANTAMFTVLDGLLFRRLPYPDPSTLMVLQVSIPDGRYINATSFPFFQAIKESSHSFEELAGESLQTMILSGTDGAEPIRTELVTANYFSALRVNAALGRVFTRDETATSGSAPVVLISDGLWKRRFGSDRNIVGKSIRLNDNSFTVIGVAGPGIQGISKRAEAWIPITMIGVVSTPLLLQNDAAIWVTVLGRLNHGTSLKDAQQELNVIATRPVPGSSQNQRKGIHVTRLESRDVEQYKTEVYVLFGAVVFVLLIACLNVANLLLSYFGDRRSELAVRNALGAPRYRLIQQLLSESIVLAAIGGALGLFVAYIAVRLLGSNVTSVLPGIGPLSINLPVLAFTASVSLLSGLMAGCMPLFQVLSGTLADHLKNQSRVASSLARARLRTGLVIAQISLAVVLVVGAGLMLRSMINLESVNLGFRPEGVLVVRLSALPASKYDSPEKMTQFYRAVLDKISALPQVRADGVISSPPLLVGSPSIPFLIQGRTGMSSSHPPTAQYLIASDGYFSTLAIPLLQGRFFGGGDSSTAQKVALVNASMAAQYWPGQSPVGQYVTIFDGAESARQVIGVVGDIRDSSADVPSVPELYIPIQQVPTAFVSFLRSFPPALIVSAATQPQSLAGSIRAVIAELEPSEALLDASAMETVVSESISQPRLYTQFLSLFAAMALLLAAIGIYGVISYSVAQRTQELGIRMALGASRGRILMQVLGQGMAFTAIGVLSGAAAALGLTRLLRSFLFEIRATDPATFIGAVFCLSAAAIAAAYLPAKRASQVDPATALRQQ